MENYEEFEYNKESEVTAAPDAPVAEAAEAMAEPVAAPVAEPVPESAAQLDGIQCAFCIFQPNQL